MRSLVSLSAPARLRGLGAFLLATLVLGTGCHWITGVPDVTRVEVAVSPKTLAVGQLGVANGVAIGKNGPITSTKIRVAYTSSDPSVATVNSVSGSIVAVGEGTTEITASTRGKSGTATLVVGKEPVTRVQPAAAVVTVDVGKTATVVLTAFGASGSTLPNRSLTIGSSAPSVATVAGTTTGNVVVTGVNLGTANITGNVEGVSFGFTVSVANISAASMRLALQKGGTKLLVSETGQLVATFFDAAGQPLSAGGRGITYTSTDVTILSVTQQGVVTGLRPGTATVTAQEQGTNVKGTIDLTVEVVPVKSLIFANRNSPVFRKGATRLVTAAALDSNGNQINRAITYRSTAPSILTINPTNGTTTPNDTGTAKLIATVDNLADTLNARVTLLPIVQVNVAPSSVQLSQGQTAQFVATVVDSLLNFVTDRKPTWSSTAPAAATVNASTGLATAIAPGQTNIQAIMERVPGEGVPVGGQAVLTVDPTRVDTLDVSSTTLTVKAATTVPITIIARSANGTQLFGRLIVPTPADAGIANASVSGSTANITGIRVGTTTITFQAINAAGQAEGKPSVVTVVVN
jgi:uncharacterized protein YjdB